MGGARSSTLAERLGLASLAFPIIGAGSGGLGAQEAERIMLEALRAIPGTLRVIVVRYRRPR